MEPKSKWNSKYKERLTRHQKSTPIARLKTLAPYLTGGKARDLACGLGANSLFLAQLHYQVQAIDISDMAVNYIKEQAEIQQFEV